jgi:hypothetical protein
LGAGSPAISGAAHPTGREKRQPLTPGTQNSRLEGSAARSLISICVGDRETRADGQCGELIDCIAAGSPVRELLFIEALGHTRAPFAWYRPDHRAGVELATIEAHRAAEAAADLDVDSMMVLRARRGGTGSKYPIQR